MLRIFGLVVVAVLALAASGCGGSGGSTTPAPVAGGGHSAAPTDVVVDVHSGVGAFAPVAATVDDRPDFRLYGDGTVFARGEGTGLPALSTYALSPEGVEAVLRAAAAAGLLAESPPYGEPAITDVGSTVVALQANGRRYEHAAFALGFELDGDQLLTQEQRAARKALRGFVELVTTLPGARPELLASRPSPYDPEAVDVYAWSLDGDAGDVEVADWPLAQPLGEIPAIGPVESRCLTVTGADLRSLEQSVSERDGSAFWRSGAAVFSVGFRTLLPGQQGCGVERTS